MILAGKRLLITGVITKDSIAFHVAEQAQREGAAVVLTSFGRVRRLTERAAQRLPEPVDVLELDINREEDLAASRTALGERWGGARRRPARDRVRARRLDRRSVHDRSGRTALIEAFRTSAFSLKALAAALAPLMPSGGSIVGHRLRRLGRMADLRLDGRREGRAGVGQPRIWRATSALRESA